MSKLRRGDPDGAGVALRQIIVGVGGARGRARTAGARADVEAAAEVAEGAEGVTSLIYSTQASHTYVIPETVSSIKLRYLYPVEGVLLSIASLRSCAASLEGKYRPTILRL